MSVFLIASASSTVLPLSHSVARLELAIAEPQPNVLNFASSMTPVVGVHLDLQLHDVAALRRADQPGADVRIVLRQRADVARVLVVIDHLVRISHFCPLQVRLRAALPIHPAIQLHCRTATSVSVGLPTASSTGRRLPSPARRAATCRAAGSRPSSACPPRSRLLPSVVQRPRPKRIDECARSSPAPSAFSTYDGSRLADVQAEPDDTATSLMPISSDSPST